MSREEAGPSTAGATSRRDHDRKWAVIGGLLDHMMTLPLTGPWRPDTWTVFGLMLEVMRDDVISAH